MIFALIKWFLVIFFSCSFVVIQLLAKVFFRGPAFTAFTSRHTQFMARLGVRILGLRIQTNLDRKVTGEFVVANHLSYVDILVLLSLFPASFVTSEEIRETHFLGQVTAGAGCFFVERRRDRRSPEVLQKEIHRMTGALRAGNNIVVFPEGTSTNGETVLSFKKTLFQVPVSAGVPVTPIILRYEISPERRDHVYWYGTMTFADHLFRLCTLREVAVIVTVLPKLDAFQRDEVAALSETTIRDAHRV